MHYNAAAELTAATLGNGLNETHTYDSRFRPLTIGAGSVYNVTIPASGGYAPNSNIMTANDSVNGNWTYSYDDFNRLAAASATGQAYTWDYDRYGNRWHQNGPNSAQYAFDANNRVASGSGVTYDAAGDVTNDGTSTFTYDAENRMTSATNSSRGLTCYIYNASGQRVRKTFSTVGTCAAPTSSTPNDYIYDIGGNIVGIPGSREEIFVGNHHLGTYVFSTTYFVHSDWLGTERARSSATGAPYETATSLPFGDALTSAGGSDPSPLHFTGLQHDYEATEDHTLFRQYSPLIGRWSIPDPADLAAANPSNPQSWNRYAYVMNNPMALIDPSGLNECAPGEHDCNWGLGEGNPGQDLFGAGLFFGPGNPGNGGGGGFGPDPTVPAGCNFEDDQFGGEPVLVCSQGGGGHVGSAGGRRPPGCPPGDACDPTSQPFNNNAEIRNCVNDYYNSRPGKTIEFGSLLSMVPGWDPDPGKNILENIVLLGGKLLGLRGAVAAGNASVLSIHGTSTAIAGPVEKLAGTAAGKVLTGAEVAAPYAIVGATVADIMAHQVCTVAAYPIPSVASPF